MYVRPPNPNRQKIKIPENYSGNAFSQSPSLNDMPPPVRQTPSRYDLPPTETDSSVESETIEPLSDRTPDAQAPTDEKVEQRSEERLLLPVSAVKEKEKSSIFSSLLPPGINFSSHFPFGHGIGSEEIIILAVMLLVYLSGSDDGDCDHELILLLGLLLLAG